MADAPYSNGRSIVSVFLAVMVLTVALAMIAAGGGLRRPLTAPKSAVAMTPAHAKQS